MEGAGHPLLPLMLTQRFSTSFFHTTLQSA
nr:MAG TPA: hypothetical protein [Caudoviricetes sp.]